MSSKRAGMKKHPKRRGQRATSNIFAMFDQAQIQEFKEAFNMIDQNRDGFIDNEDLKDMLASLGMTSLSLNNHSNAFSLSGQEPSDAVVDEMMGEAPGPLNFTMFLTLFGEKLTGTDPEDVIRNAFACFDEEGVGTIHEDRLRELLTTMGDRITDAEVDQMLRGGAPVDSAGNFDYVAFTRILKHGTKED
ncbi:PREDICTED: myosin regulatory light chain 12B-like isoform X1 [Amphimedon queenslandica]|uniref:EF-hand domain-containing protein n=1 Tax=Amphimedon queenslandica TaxID=400682 RepID=A0AAN0K599_AMPQE|nr:PREDICTED: myosin regulatory light chain 12B-like isoform X1 [Amphimedon queenslandica]|eukprot:XP_019864414.1 PREDICTED: myosin regulatory light chain 12B-like isoform X1 [Amphimedon queenslandica]